MATKTATVSAALEHIRELLDHDRPGEALNFITHFGNSSPEMENARAVCLLRLGRLDEAIEVLRDLTFEGLQVIPDHVPALFQVNFAIAMLRANRDKGGPLAISDRLTGNEHPEAARLKAAVDQWKKSLGPLGRLRCRLGLYPAQPVPLDERAGAV
jgi:sugar phosphate isomerase/epimerase